MALLKVICCRFPPGKSLVTIVNMQYYVVQSSLLALLPALCPVNRVLSNLIARNIFVTINACL